MKKLVGYLMMLFCFVMLGSMVPVADVASAQGSSSEQGMIHMIVEGEEVEPDVPPLITNGRTLVPVRVIAEGLGADVTWDQQKQTATIVRDKKRLELQLNNKKALVDGKQVTLEASPMLQDNRMLLPLRFVGEALGSTIGWEQETRTIVANRTISLQVNGKDISDTVKSYKLDGTLFLPVQHIAEKLGLQAGAITDQVSKRRVIDSILLASVTDVENIVGGKIEWNKEKNEVVVERLNQLKGITISDNDVTITTSKADIAKPEVLVLQGPHRIVLDFPNMVLSESMFAKMGEEIRPEPVDEEGTEEEAAGQRIDDSTVEHEEIPADIHGVAPTSSNQEVSQPFIKQIRYSQYSDSPYTVRVVIEVTGKSSYQLAGKLNGMDIQLIPGTKKTGFLIVVDAGHGGKDIGAKGVAGNVEKDFNLKVANRVVEILKQNSKFQVISTRSTDVFLELSERVAIANDQEADVFLSIHANSFKPQTRGTETYYYTKQSEELARIVHRHLLGATQFPDRTVQTSGFYVIKNTKMPSVLTETGFLTNQIENSKLISPEFQEKVAQALAAAINEYYNANY